MAALQVVVGHERVQIALDSESGKSREQGLLAAGAPGGTAGVGAHI
jgi:hypothetical protein